MAEGRAYLKRVEIIAGLDDPKGLLSNDLALPLGSEQGQRAWVDYIMRLRREAYDGGKQRLTQEA